MFFHSSQRRDTRPSDPSTDSANPAPPDLRQQAAESTGWEVLRAVEFEQLAAILAIKAGGGSPLDEARPLLGGASRAGALVPRGCLRAWSRLRHGWRRTARTAAYGRRSNE
jgi:hypothetical protein